MKLNFMNSKLLFAMTLLFGTCFAVLADNVLQVPLMSKAPVPTSSKPPKIG